MFVRKKHNRSDTVSVVIVDKHHGVYHEVRVIGTSSDESELKELVQQGQDWIRRQNILPDIFEQYEREKTEKERLEYFSKNSHNSPESKANTVPCATYQLPDCGHQVQTQ